MELTQVYTRIENINEIRPKLADMKAKRGQKWSKSYDFATISSKIWRKIAKFSQVDTDKSSFSRWKSHKSMELPQVYTRIEEIFEIGPKLADMKAKRGQKWSKSHDFPTISSKIWLKIAKISQVDTDKSIFSRWKCQKSMELPKVYTRIEEICEIGPKLADMKAKWGKKW